MEGTTNRLGNSVKAADKPVNEVKVTSGEGGVRTFDFSVPMYFLDRTSPVMTVDKPQFDCPHCGKTITQPKPKHATWADMLGQALSAPVRNEEWRRTARKLKLVEKLADSPRIDLTPDDVSMLTDMLKETDWNKSLSYLFIKVINPSALDN
jgi:hypothetical protein